MMSATNLIYDRSHWGLLRISGEDRLRYLHNQSTNNIQQLKSGQGCDTVFVTSTARTIDLATVYLTEEAILVLVSPNRRQYLLEWLDRYLFPMDKVELADLSSEYAVFQLIGSESDTLLKQLGLEVIIDRPQFSHQLVTIDDIEVRIAVGSGLAIPGYTFIAAKEKADSIWQKLTANGAKPIDDLAWEQLRILQGRPIPDKELTEDYNPLEVGLWQCISFDKGCYIGQETIARLNTYKGVKQRLWGVKLNAAVEPETKVTVGEEKVGVLTSYTPIEGGHFGLAYVRTKAGGAGLEVKVGETRGELVEVPFLSHE
jgi:hypothetical protein